MGESPAAFYRARAQQNREMEGNCSRDEAFTSRRFNSGGGGGRTGRNTEKRDELQIPDEKERD